ncbi:MAG TPA: O-antigen ligase family protein [Ktedonobacterales bacterium]|nr:O-antigen ligase family protein [Ktedonobacterales bacterium]
MKRSTTFFLICIGLTLALEMQGPPADPWANFFWRWAGDLSSWIPIHIVVSPLEISLIVLALIWSFRGRKVKKSFAYLPGSLDVPILVFLGFVLFGVLNGAARPGGNLTIALWEVRGFLMLIGMYYLTGIFIRGEREVNRLIWTLFIATTVLAVENLLRWMTLLGLHTTDDNSFEHIDSVILVCGLLLGAAICIYGGTRAQRRYSYFLMPLSFFCMMIMGRRAAFPVLGFGVIALVVFLLRLRPRIFWKYVPIMVVLIAAYLAVFWNNTSVLGQPARAIASQFHPDPRDYNSDLYRIIEKGDIQANIFSAPLTGLGFGQQFQMYYPLPDLSFWPFWHYETHNAILWVWMKDGMLGFIAFWWLMGRGMFDGGKAVESQREEWALAQYFRKRLAREHRNSQNTDWHVNTGVFRVALRSHEPDTKRGKRRATSEGSLALNVPVWERSDDKRSVTLQRSGVLALLVVSICMIPAQVVFSYVDLGLTSERDLLLFGLMLGLVARGHALLGTQVAEKGKRSTRKGITISPSAASEESRELARRILLLPVGATRFPALKAPASRPASRPLVSDVPPSPTAQPSSEQTPPSAPAPRATAGPRSRPVLTRPRSPASRPLVSRPLPQRAAASEAATGGADGPPLPWERRGGGAE